MFMLYLLARYHFSHRLLFVKTGYPLLLAQVVKIFGHVHV